MNNLYKILFLIVLLSLLLAGSSSAEVNTLWTGEIAVLIPGRGYVMMDFYPDRHGQAVGFAPGWLLIVENIEGKQGRGVLYDNITALEVTFHLNTAPNILSDKWIVVDLRDAVEIIIPMKIYYPEKRL